MKSTMSLLIFMLAASISAIAVPQGPPLPAVLLNVLIPTGRFGKLTPGIVQQLCEVQPFAQLKLDLSKVSLAKAVDDLLRTAKDLGLLQLVFNANQDTITLDAPTASHTQPLLQTLQTFESDIKAASSAPQLCQVMKSSLNQFVDQLNEAMNDFAESLEPCYRGLVNGFVSLVKLRFQLFTTPQQSQRVIKDNFIACLELIISGLHCLRVDLNADTQSVQVDAIEDAIQVLGAQKASLNSNVAIGTFWTAIDTSFTYIIVALSSLQTNNASPL